MEIHIASGYILTIDQQPVQTLGDIQQWITQAHQQKHHTIEIPITMINKQAIHFTDGVPHLYFDQLNIITKHLQDLKSADDTHPQIQIIQSPPDTDNQQQFTHAQLQKHSDWADWQQAQYKNLQQYKD